MTKRDRSMIRSDRVRDVRGRLYHIKILSMDDKIERKRVRMRRNQRDWNHKNKKCQFLLPFFLFYLELCYRRTHTAMFEWLNILDTAPASKLKFRATPDKYFLDKLPPLYNNSQIEIMHEHNMNIYDDRVNFKLAVCLLPFAFCLSSPSTI